MKLKAIIKAEGLEAKIESYGKRSDGSIVHFTIAFCLWFGDIVRMNFRGGKICE
jgi:hypothetical protein